MSRPSVALVFPEASRRGGVERAVRELARRLAAERSTTFVGDRMDSEGMGSTAFASMSSGARGVLAPFTFAREAQRVLDGLHPDVTVSFGANCPPGDVLYVNSVHKAWLRHGRPLETRLGAVPNAVRYLLARHQALLLAERRYFHAKRPTAYITVSNQTADEICELYGIDRDAVTIIPNGYDEVEFTPSTRHNQRERLRGELAIDADEIVLLLVANELHRKGLATLIDAVVLVADPRLRIDVVGRAPLGSYADRAERAGIGARLRWHGPASDVAHWYALADLLVMPTQYEAYPLVVVESLASGLPVITTAVAGSADAIQHDVNGLLQHDPDDAEELADLLRRALDPEARVRWSEAAPNTVADQEWGRLAERFANVIDSVAGR